MTHDEQKSTAQAASRSTSSAEGEYVVVARRYRPQTFEELIGQEHVARALAGAISANRVGHAYLFTGARGVGKTSAARILAKALDCIHGPTPTPCNQCDICQSISAGSDVDVLEIDGASNRGIDEIRQLRQNVSIRPSRARFKIYIIDEVHMLTREAFNALLKTLEEPPEHVKFIFCTTEANKIPITILSRCQRFDFAGIQLPNIVERLRQIVEAEGVKAEPEALALLARRANGSMRDSQSLLEQLLAFAGETITVADVHAMLGTAGEARLADLVAHLVDGNAAGAIQELDEALEQGVDVGQLLEQLLGYFRDMMMTAVGCPAASLLHTSATEQPKLAEVSRKLGLETVLGILQILDQTLARLRYSTQSRTLAEMALVRIANLENLTELADLIAQLRSAEPAGAVLKPAGAPATQAARPQTAPTAKKKEELNGEFPEAAAQHDAAEHARAPENGAAAASSAAPAPLDPEQAQAMWDAALASISGLLADNAALAEHVALAGPRKLVATFREKYTSCKKFCERPDQLAALKSALAEATDGAPVEVEFVTAPDEPATSAPAKSMVSTRRRMADTAEHPLVRRASELFDARIVRIDESKT
ncbi:MAG TPA: DNA polymerase III subunit gamma/tau [Pirellulales bacterium]|jgi:DNA polymerase-3 subunit gamma/tau|nr:DNA polymerase III subunit gamma/tau [Pirellulales bacterium]